MASSALVPRSLFHWCASVCSKVVPTDWVPATGVIQHVHRRLSSARLSSRRRLEPAAEIREDRFLPSDNSSTMFVESARCLARGKVSSCPAGPQDVGCGSAESKGKTIFE